MIVDPDFVDHWKTRTLVALLDDDEAAPVYVIRLWAHCQNRRTWIFDLPAPALKAICRFPGDAQKFELAMIECGFVARNDVEISIVGWEIYNASLIAAWANGGKGGRPAKPKKDINSETQGKPMGNPPVNPGDNPRVTHGVTDKSREDKSREEHKPAAAPARPRKTALPKDFSISDNVREWAKEHGHGNLEAHLDSFIRKATMKGYSYVNWDMAFMEAVRENWAKLPAVNGSGQSYDARYVN